MSKEDSTDSSSGSGSGAGDFPEGREPALFGHDNPGDTTWEPPQPRNCQGQNAKRKSLSAGHGSVRLVAASLPLPLGLRRHARGPQPVPAPGTRPAHRLGSWQEDGRFRRDPLAVGESFAHSGPEISSPAGRGSRSGAAASRGRAGHGRFSPMKCALVSLQLPCWLPPWRPPP